MDDSKIHFLDQITVEIGSFGQENSNIAMQWYPRCVGLTVSQIIIINRDFDWEMGVDVLNNIIRELHSESKLATKDIRGLIVHELGHLLSFQECYCRDLLEAREEYLKSCFIKSISAYSNHTFDGAESLAEAFDRKYNREKNSPDAERLLEEFIGRWKK